MRKLLLVVAMLLLFRGVARAQADPGFMEILEILGILDTDQADAGFMD